MNLGDRLTRRKELSEKIKFLEKRILANSQPDNWMIPEPKKVAQDYNGKRNNYKI